MPFFYLLYRHRINSNFVVPAFSPEIMDGDILLFYIFVILQKEIREIHYLNLYFAIFYKLIYLSFYFWVLFDNISFLLGMLGGRLKVFLI